MKSNNHNYMGPERRHFVRIPFEAVVQYKVHKAGEREASFREAKSKNISTSGLLFKSHDHFTPGTILELEFTVPTEEGYSEVQILGKVVRVVEMPGKQLYDNGIVFYKIKRKDEKAILNLVDFLQDEDEES